MAYNQCGYLSYIKTKSSNTRSGSGEGGRAQWPRGAHSRIPSILFTFGSWLIFEKYLCAYQVTDATLARYKCSAHWGMFLLFYSLEGTTALSLGGVFSDKSLCTQGIPTAHELACVSSAGSQALPPSTLVSESSFCVPNAKFTVSP